MFKKFKFNQILTIIIALTLMFSAVQPSAVSAQSSDGVKRQINPQSGRVSFIGPESGRALPAFRALGMFARPQDPARALAERFAPEFGLKNPSRELSEMKAVRSEDGRVTARYQQMYNGVPVMGGELIVNTNERGDLYSMNGEVSPKLSLGTTPRVDSAQAAETALQAMAKWYQRTPGDFSVSEPELWIYDESLLRPSSRPVELVWRMEVTAKDNALPVRELVLVNAERGGISLHFNQIDTAWLFSPQLADQRLDVNTPKKRTGLTLGSPIVSTYTANNTSSLPGTFLCNQTQPTCTNGSNPEADFAHRYAIGTYNFYANNFNRDSIDNNGMPIVSTVQYCDPSSPCPYGNAFWDGAQMVYGSAYGFALADDIVAHELTHGVTQYESNLFYYYQSGAISESFSDLWGEYYDQTNGQGNDNVTVRWLLGEDVTGLGAVRSMSNPLAFNDPDRMSSPNYYEGADDNGGVHTNSGVNNKAVYLMVDGGAFNGKTVTALGWEKTGAIYYEASTNLLASGADYSDLYYALQQACANLIGQHGITSADCVEVKDALDAVEMNGQPAPNFNTDAPLCTTPGTGPSIIFADDLESGTSNWTFNNGSYPRWQLDTPYGPYAQSGLHSLYADDYPAAITDASARLTSFVVPANAFLHFAHAYDFETDTVYWDGGVLEYSINNGATWVDAGSLMDYNGYNGALYNNSNNPLKGRSAFVGTSHGYISTRLNLASLAGQTVSFRWRMGLDNSGFSWGWWVDNIKVYNCISFTISGNAGASGVTLSYVDGTTKTVTSAADGNYSLSVPPGWSGTVTPSHPCYTFSPASRTYTNVIANQTSQNYTATFNPASGCANVNLFVGTELKGIFGVPGMGVEFSEYPGMLAGPVKVVSTNSEAVFTTQVVTSGGSYNELAGYPVNQFTTEYWFPYYDHGYPNVGGNNMRTWILVGNPSDSQAAEVEIYIGGVLKGSYTIPAGGNVTPRWVGLVGGPVQVKSTNGVNIFASERVFTVPYNSFNEVMGYPANQFTTEYWFPWYDTVYMNTYLLVGNTSATQSAKVEIYIGASKMGTYSIAPNSTLKQRYAGKVDGPVRVVSINGVNIVASEYTLSGTENSFNEVMGYPFDQFEREYWFPYYDHGYPSVTGSKMRTWILVGNPSDSLTANVEIYIDGVLQGSYAIPPKGNVTPRWIGVQGGPVRVVSDNPIFVSERVFTVPSNAFNEFMGIPLTQLTTEYWFTWYDSVYMNNKLLISKP